jgi:hypothetical protein
MATDAAPVTAPRRSSRSWRITIVMPDGSRGHHTGIYPDGCSAVLHAMDLFPEAWRVSAKPLTMTQKRRA